MKLCDPPSQAILIAMQAHWSNTIHIAQCDMSMATPEATGCCHWVTTCSVLPQVLPGQNDVSHLERYHSIILLVCLTKVRC
jgi:hypothetical protein